MAYDEFIEPIKHGNYTVRLLKNDEELREYKDLRYKHLLLAWNPERALTDPPGTTDENIGYDADNYQICAFYRDPKTGKEKIVGGYVMMRFKKEDDFCKILLKYDMAEFLKKHKFEMLELTRAVIHPEHRDGIVLKMLWLGIITYAKKYNLQFTVGTMSLVGTDPLKYTLVASFLHHNLRMSESIMVRPLEGINAYYYDIIPKEKIETFGALKQMPALMKGFLKMGAEFGDGFYIDYDLKTVEVFAMLDLKKYEVEKRMLNNLI